MRWTRFEEWDPRGRKGFVRRWGRCGSCTVPNIGTSRKSLPEWRSSCGQLEREASGRAAERLGRSRTRCDLQTGGSLERHSTSHSHERSDAGTEYHRGDDAVGAAASGGDPAAGAELAERFRESLLRFCWGYLGSTDQAEDAVQDIFCKVAAAETIPELFRPWLYKVARNHCLTLRRNRAARKDNRPLPAASQVFHALTGNLTRLARGGTGPAHRVRSLLAGGSAGNAPAAVRRGSFAGRNRRGTRSG